jgi:hypothetical protein
MQVAIQLSQARRIVREAEACLQQLKKMLDALDGPPELISPDPWDALDDLALMRLTDDGNPHGD